MGSNDDSLKLCLPDTVFVGKIFCELKVLNIGENPMSDWIEIGNVFGQCPKLFHLKVSYMEIETIKYRKGIFEQMKRLWIRDNKFKDVAVFDELNLFSNLSQINFVQNTFEDTFGFMVLRDLAIAKIKNLHVCNMSLVKPKERNDAELFYLKWITKQIDNKENDMQIIEKLYPRYIELVKKHGDMNLNKKIAEKLLAVTVMIKSMDPESITAKPVEKKLPTAMTVGQLKMLCKRLFKLKPQYQRLMYREGTNSLPDDMYDDTRPISFYNIKDGMEILMQSSDFEKK